jgi:hypothetical protein
MPRPPLLRFAALLVCACACACAKTEPKRPLTAEPAPLLLPLAPSPAKSVEAASATGAAPAASAVGAERELWFTGMCDASGAVPLNDRLFAVADDEDNILRVYDADRGGAPLGMADVSTRLSLPHKAKKPKKKPRKKPLKWPETDIEAGTRLGELAFWITSHGRNSSGKLKSERHRLFATSLPEEGDDLELSVEGVAYDRLLADLAADPRFKEFGLLRAAELAPKEAGGLNIEGMTAREEGGVWIGFRNPVPNGRALLFALLNPEQVIQGEPARFGDPLTLDLGGLGVRSLSFWRGRYLIVAGHYAGGAPSRLYAWNGRDGLTVLGSVGLDQFNPEGFFTPETRDTILLLSDDGSVMVDDTECKRQKDAQKKRFRGVWVALPADSPN